jgi:hypothetical protein
MRHTLRLNWFVDNGRLVSKWRRLTPTCGPLGENGVYTSNRVRVAR